MRVGAVDAAILLVEILGRLMLFPVSLVVALVALSVIDHVMRLRLLGHVVFAGAIVLGQSRSGHQHTAKQNRSKNFHVASPKDCTCTNLICGRWKGKGGGI